MKRFIAPLVALSLVGCATVFTPARCSDILSGLTSAERLTKVLIDRGFETERAKSIAHLLLLGILSTEAVCSADVNKINAATLPAPADESEASESLAEVVIASR